LIKVVGGGKRDLRRPSIPIIREKREIRRDGKKISGRVEASFGRKKQKCGHGLKARGKKIQVGGKK